MRLGKVESAPLAAFREEIAVWRSVRKRCSPMPPRLWSNAAKLATEHGVGKIAKEFGLNYVKLKAIMNDEKFEAISKRVNEKSEPVRPDVDRSNGEPEKSGRTVVELARPDGATMTIHHAGYVSDDVIKILKTFVEN